MRTKEIPVCGRAAVQALCAKDVSLVKRLFFDYATSRSHGKLASELAKAKRIYRVVTPAELEKVAGTVHHGGIVAIIDAPALGTVTDEVIRGWSAERIPLLLLDRIGNAHNLGAIARSAAFFGVQHLILPEHPQQAMPSESAYRTAEGGLSHLTLWSVREMPAVCRALAPSHDVVGAAVGGTTQALQRWTASRGKGAARPIALVLGNEEGGLSDEVKAACTALVRLPGNAERVESLNVSAAAAVFCWEFWGRQEATGAPSGSRK